MSFENILIFIFQSFINFINSKSDIHLWRKSFLVCSIREHFLIKFLSLSNNFKPVSFWERFFNRDPHHKAIMATNFSSRWENGKISMPSCWNCGEIICSKYRKPVLPNITISHQLRSNMSHWWIQARISEIIMK